MSDYPSEMPEEPKGVGSIIRVVFEGLGDLDPETFYVGVAPGLWAEYGADGVDEFTWQQMLQIIEYDEAEIFEVVYEGLGGTEKYDEDAHRVRDLFWSGAR